MKCVVIDGYVLDGVRQLLFFSFLLDKPAGYKVFCQFETIHCKKINKSVLNIITYYLEDEDKEEFDFNGKNDYFYITFDQILSYYMSF